MSDKEPKKTNTPLKSPNPERFQPKVLLIWMIILLAIGSLWIFNPGRPMVDEVTIRQVAQWVEEEQILGTPTMRPFERGGREAVIIEGRVQTTEEVQEDGFTQTEESTGHFRAQGRLTDENLQLFQQAGFKEEQGRSLFGDIMISLLPFILIIGLLYFLFMRQLRGAGKGAMSFGKSKARLLTRDRTKVTFKQVAGCDEAKEEVSEVVEFLRDPKKFQRIGGRIPKGILMVGPPGTGKTLLAKAVAGEADVPFYSISGSDFVEMFVGVGASRVRDMFEQGRKNSPCLIFIDEIDAVGRQRGAGLGGGNDEREQTLNSLLVEMDGIDEHEGVIIIAATNRPDVLDQALLRPGRFDRQIQVDLPDVKGREEILDVHAKKIKLAETVDLGTVAKMTPGLSGADLANLLNESALTAARYNKKEVDMYDINEAREKIAFGRERRRIMDEDDKKLVAYHEAGHALVQAVLDDGSLPLHKVTIIPRGQSLGSTMFLPAKDTYNYSKKRLLNQIACVMGGRIAEEIIFDDVTSGASGDIKQATKIARHMVCDWGMSDLGPIALGENQDTVFLGRDINRSQNYSPETAEKIDRAIRQLVDEQYERAKKVLEDNRDALDKMAEALLEHETIEGKHVHEILEKGAIHSEVVQNKVQPPELTPEKEESAQKAKKKSKKSGPEGDPVNAPA
ncbi:MAG: ATP-dependent zinc metalloprotease FtsH [Opitutales bacterium]|nr:ATP-dependent zinc metalloprotease FtsH [Opitutales bacterium]